MYNNLITKLRQKNITNKAVAELIGVTEKTLFNKINGTTEFTVLEAMSINKNLLPEYRLDYLFTRTA